MTLFKRIAACLLLLACATVQAQTDTTTAERLVRESGLQEQIGVLSNAFPAALMQGMVRARKRPTDAEMARIRQRADQAFATDRLQQTVAGVVSDNMQPRHIPVVLNWYASKAGQVIRQAEVAATTEQAMMQPDVLMRDGQVLWTQMPHARRQLLADLIVSLRMTESMLQITENSMLAKQRGLALADPEFPLLNVDQMRKRFLAHRPTMLETFSEVAQSSVALTYHNVPDQVLRDYLDYSNNPAGRHFNDLSMQALEHAFSNSITSLMQSFLGTRDNQNR